MASFEFTVNKSFLGGSGHPITIPRSQLPYRTLCSLGLDYKHVVVTLPRGERHDGRIHQGIAGFGEYHQLRFVDSQLTLPSYIKLSDRLIIFLEKAGRHSHAILEYKA